MTIVTVRLSIYDGEHEFRSEHLHPRTAKAILERLILAKASGDAAVQAQLLGLLRGELPPPSSPTN